MGYFIKEVNNLYPPLVEIAKEHVGLHDEQKRHKEQMLSSIPLVRLAHKIALGFIGVNLWVDHTAGGLPHELMVFHVKT